MALIDLTHQGPDRDTEMRESIAASNHILDLAAMLKARWLVMVAAFVDESEQRSDGIFVVAGYLFSPRSLQKLEKGWQKNLSRYQISEFHMSKLAHRKGEFEGWSEGNRKGLQDRLINLIIKHAEFQICVAIDTRVLDSLSTDDRKVLADLNKYSIAASEFSVRVQKAVGQDEPIAYFFDQNPNKAGKKRIEYEILDQIRRGKISRRTTVSWGDSREYSGLQAADFLAYEFAKISAKTIRTSEATHRVSGNRIYSGMGLERRSDIFFDHDSIHSMIDAFRNGGGLTPVNSRTKKSG